MCFSLLKRCGNLWTVAEIASGAADSKVFPLQGWHGPPGVFYPKGNRLKTRREIFVSRRKSARLI